MFVVCSDDILALSAFAIFDPFVSNKPIYVRFFNLVFFLFFLMVEETYVPFVFFSGGIIEILGVRHRSRDTAL